MADCQINNQSINQLSEESNPARISPVGMGTGTGT